MAFLFFFVFIYLFWLSCVLVAAWGIFIVACGLLSCGMWTLSCGMWTVSCSMHVGSSSPTRDQTQPPCTGNTESYPLDHQGSPCSWHLCVWEQVSIFLLIWILGWLYWNIYILKYFIKNYFFPSYITLGIIFLKKLLFILFIYFSLHQVFVAMRAFSSCGKQGLLFVVVHGLLIAVASLVAEHGL